MKKHIALLILYILTGICIVIMMEACSSVKHTTNACPVKWTNSIHNPDNEDYVVEVAFNLNKPVDKVTQCEFNERYKEE